jgi:hypothetical protein
MQFFSEYQSADKSKVTPIIRGKKKKRGGFIVCLCFHATPCSLGLSSASQQYFSLTPNQPPAISTRQDHHVVSRCILVGLDVKGETDGAKIAVGSRGDLSLISNEGQAER